MLDASTQAHVAAVITAHQHRHGTGVLLLTHDPALMHRWADRIVTWPPEQASDPRRGRRRRDALPRGD